MVEKVRLSSKWNIELYKNWKLFSFALFGENWSAKIYRFEEAQKHNRTSIIQLVFRDKQGKKR